MPQMIRSALLALMLVSLQTVPGLAQPCDPGQLDCSSVILGQSSTQSALRNSRMVKSIIGSRLAPNPNYVSAPLSAYGPAEETSDPAAHAIAGESTTLTTNDNDVVKWNAWFDAAYIYTDRDHSISGYDGPMVAASLGFDYSVGESTLIGMLLSYENTDFDTAFGGGIGRLESNSFGIGLYAGSAITEHIVADAMLIWSRANTDVVETGPNSGSFDSDRVQAAANLTGYWYQDAWRFSPTLGIAWSHDEQDSYTLMPALAVSPSQTLESAVAVAGIQIGHTTFLDDVRTVEPWIGINAEWEFYSSGASGIGVPGADLDPFDVRLLGGINTQLSDSVSAIIRADIAGLARSDYLTATVGGQIAVQF